MGICYSQTVREIKIFLLVNKKLVGNVRIQEMV
jgi:hypothetical protein